MLNEISIEILRKCPNECLHCSSYSTDKCSEIIPLEVFDKVIADAKEIGLKRVSFSGGEPFLHPNIVEMVQHVSKLGLESYIYSSGIFMDDQGIRMPLPPEMLSQIAKFVTKIIFNIEAAEEKIYDQIMGTKNCFPMMIESIKRAVSSGILVEGHFVPNKINKDQVLKVLYLCNTLGVSKVSFLKLVIHGRALKNKNMLSLSETESEEINTQLKSILQSDEFNIRVGVPILGEINGAHCEAANGKLNIRYDGLVYPCEVFKNNSVLEM